MITNANLLRLKDSQIEEIYNTKFKWMTMCKAVSTEQMCKYYSGDVFK